MTTETTIPTLSELINICEKSPYTFAELQSLVIDWAKEKGIIGENQNPSKQWRKIETEKGELTDAELKVEKDGLANIIDSVGDVLVTIIIYAHQKNKNELVFVSEPNKRSGNSEQLSTRFIENYLAHDTSAMSEITQSIGYLYGLNPTDCLYSAYRVISKRTGILVNGTFIKDETKGNILDDVKNWVWVNETNETPLVELDESTKMIREAIKRDAECKNECNNCQNKQDNE